MNCILGSCEGHVEPSWHREGHCTSHQVHSDIVLWGLGKDAKLSWEDSWVEHNTGQYLQWKEQNQRLQEPGPEVVKRSQVEEDHSSPYPPPPLLRTPQYKPPVPRYKGPHCSLDQNPLEWANELEPAKVQNNPQCLEELYRSPLKEYQSCTLDHSPLPHPPPPLPHPPPSPPLQVHNEDQVKVVDCGNNRLSSPTS